MYWYMLAYMCEIFLHSQRIKYYSVTYIMCCLYYIVESGLSTKQKRRFGTPANKDVTPIYHKMVEIVELLSKHVEMQRLTDTTVLKVHVHILYINDVCIYTMYHVWC